MVSMKITLLNLILVFAVINTLLVDRLHQRMKIAQRDAAYYQKMAWAMGLDGNVTANCFDESGPIPCSGSYRWTGREWVKEH
jgi:hypothetical protein